MPFPKNLVSYEMALERAFRMLLGSQIDSHQMPAPEEVGDAYFKKIEAGEFARQWLADEKFRFPDPATDPEEELDAINHHSQEEELF